MDTRERIITESLNLFVRYGIKAVTMDTIAEHLGISKRTIYEHFKDKNHLLESCIEYQINKEDIANRQIFEHSKNLIEAFLEHIKRNVAAMNSISPLFFHDAKKYHSVVFRKKGKEHEHKSTDFIQRYIQEGKKQGYFRKDINEDIVSILLKEQFRIMGNEDIFPSDKFSKSEIFENIAINFIRGIATDKGLEIINKYHE
jgi:AcrR family transcriptional regulator